MCIHVIFCNFFSIFSSFQLKTTKSYVQKVNVFIDGERQILCQTVRKKPYLSQLLKKCSFTNDFIIETEDGKVLSALCNIVPKWSTMISCERQCLETLKALR